MRNMKSIICWRASGIILSITGTHLVRNGSLVFINKNQVHKTSPVAGSSYHDRILIQLNSKQSDLVFTNPDFSLEEFLPSTAE